MKKTTVNVFPDTDHDHGRCLNRALERAGAICNQRGTRLTPLRRRVLQLVWSGHKPLGAYDILDKLKRERGRAAPPTVYRALAFLLQQGLVHRIECRNAFVGCCEPETQHGGQFLICRVCGLAAELNDVRIDTAIRNGAASAGFAVAHGAVEVEGLCPHCQAKEGG